jgi:hypothetical protein
MNYQDYKARLTQVKQELNEREGISKTDQRLTLNDHFESIRIDIEDSILRDKITPKRGEQWLNWLDLYTCKLHPAN